MTTFVNGVTQPDTYPMYQLSFTDTSGAYTLLVSPESVPVADSGDLESVIVSVAENLATSLSSVSVTKLAPESSNLYTQPIILDNVSGTAEFSYAGTPIHYYVSLSEAPSADVVVTITLVDNPESSNNQFTVSPSSLTFSPTNWTTGQEITVTMINWQYPEEPGATITASSAGYTSDVVEVIIP